MKQTLLTIVCLLALSPTLRAQDKIHTVDGQTIECQIIDLRQENGTMLFHTQDTPDSLRQFIIPSAIKYIEYGGTKMVFTPWNTYVKMGEKFAVQSPFIANMYGVSGFYSSAYYGFTASYAHFFTRSSGLLIELMHHNAVKKFPRLRGYGIMPSYEYRAYLQQMGSFFHVQFGLGLIYYRAPFSYLILNRDYTYTEVKGVSKVLAPTLGIKIGLDIRLTRGLYLDLSGHANWCPKSIKISDEMNAYINRSFGIGAGLRFGREQ